MLEAEGRSINPGYEISDATAAITNAPIAVTDANKILLRRLRGRFVGRDMIRLSAVAWFVVTAQAPLNNGHFRRR